MIMDAKRVAGKSTMKSLHNTGNPTPIFPHTWSAATGIANEDRLRTVTGVHYTPNEQQHCDNAHEVTVWKRCGPAQPTIFDKELRRSSADSATPKDNGKRQPLHNLVILPTTPKGPCGKSYSAMKSGTACNAVPGNGLSGSAVSAVTILRSPILTDHGTIKQDLNRATETVQGSLLPIACQRDSLKTEAMKRGSIQSENREIKYQEMLNGVSGKIHPVRTNTLSSVHQASPGKSHLGSCRTEDIPVPTRPTATAPVHTELQRIQPPRASVLTSDVVPTADIVLKGTAISPMKPKFSECAKQMVSNGSLPKIISTTVHSENKVSTISSTPHSAVANNFSEPEPLGFTDSKRSSQSESFSQPHNGPHVGLFNHGNTCYMSAILQCLRFTPAFFQMCVSTTSAHPNPPKSLSSLTQLFNNMAAKKTHAELYGDVERLRRQLSCTFSLCIGSEQQDALEFLVCLLDTLHSELKQGTADCYRASPPGSTVDSTSLETGNEESGLTFLQSDMGNAAKNKLPTREKIKNLFRPSRRRMIEHMAEEAPRETSPQVGRPPEPPEQKPPDTGKTQHPADISWEEENRRECSFVKDIFMGQIQTYRKCLECNHEKVSYGVVWNLSLPIPTCSPVGSVCSVYSDIPTAADRLRTVPERSNGDLLYDGLKNPTSGTWSSKKKLILFDASNAGSLHSSKSITSSALHGELFGGSPGRVPSSSLSPRIQPTVTMLPMTLAQCFQNDAVTEILRDSDRPWCDRCKRKTKCLMQNTISRLPRILIIHLLRFQCGERRQKNTVHVSFDMKLDVSEYMVSEYEKGRKFESHRYTEEDTVYQLYAVVYHDGVMCSGHYTAACRIPSTEENEPDRWFLFDDESVREIPPQSVNRASAYLLFYEKEFEYQQRRMSSLTKDTRFPQVVTVTSRL